MTCAAPSARPERPSNPYRRLTAESATRRFTRSTTAILERISRPTQARALRTRHKHLKLDQGKIDFAKRYFGVDSEQQAIERALCPRPSFLSSTGAISCTVLSCVDG